MISTTNRNSFKHMRFPEFSSHRRLAAFSKKILAGTPVFIGFSSLVTIPEE